MLFDRMRGGAVAVFLVLAWLAPASGEPSASRKPPGPACEVGSYAMADGTLLDVGPGEAAQLRWRRLDGRTGALTPQGDGSWTSTLGWTDRPDGHRAMFPDCR